MSVRGFSLIELLSVLVLLSVLSLFAVPSFQQLIVRYQLKQDVSSVEGLVRMIRMQAIGRGTDMYFTLEHEIAGTRLCWEDRVHARECSELIRNAHLEWNFAANPMLFRGLTGMAGFSAGHIRVRHRDAQRLDQYRVIVSTLGRIRVCAVHGPESVYEAC